MPDRNLYVVAVCSNTERWASRYRLFKEFEQRVLDAKNVVLIVVEHQLGDRPFAITDKENRNHLQVRAGAESLVWTKESLINIGIKHCIGQHPECKYIAWIDADVEFVRKDWAQEAVELLQHYKVIQPWSHSIDLGPKYQPLSSAESFCYSYWHQEADLEKERVSTQDNVSKLAPEIYDPYTYYSGGGTNFKTSYTFHPGYAWCIRRDAYEHLESLIDWCAMGSGDHTMAHALVGNVHKAVHSKSTDGYKQLAQEWQGRCDQHIKQDIGYVPGTLLHHWHGSKKERWYVDRAKVLLSTNYDPLVDVKRNQQGLLVLTGNNLKLRDAFKRYAQSRNEDRSTED